MEFAIDCTSRIQTNGRVVEAQAVDCKVRTVSGESYAKAQASGETMLYLLEAGDSKIWATDRCKFLCSFNGEEQMFEMFSIPVDAKIRTRSGDYTGKITSKEKRCAVSVECESAFIANDFVVHLC